MPLTTEVAPGLILGRLAELDDILEMRPDVLVPLARLEGDVWDRGFRGEILYCPVTDRGVLPDDVLDGLVESIMERLGSGKRVALFCIGGHGRTGYIGACVLYRLGHADPVAYLWKHYSVMAPESDAQFAAISRFCLRHPAGHGQQ